MGEVTGARARGATRPATSRPSTAGQDKAKYQAKTGIGTNFCQARKETEAKYQADNDKNLCLPYQAETKEDKAKYQAETGAVTDLGHAEKETKAKHKADDNKNLCLRYQAKTEAKYQAHGDRNDCPRYQAKTGAKYQDEAKYQAKTSIGTDNSESSDGSKEHETEAKEDTGH